jgi:hypothetical protein
MTNTYNLYLFKAAKFVGNFVYKATLTVIALIGTLLWVLFLFWATYKILGGLPDPNIQ